MAGDDKAWKEMKKYQIQDVNLLVDLYDLLLPWFVTGGRVSSKEKQAIQHQSVALSDQHLM
jgi:hypothetical protein